MGNSVVRNLIGLLILIVLSFTVGIMAADSAKSAAMIIFVITGIIGLIIMGKHVWVALFLLPPVCWVLPPVGGVRMDHVLYAMVLCCWLLFRMLGYVKFTWRKLIGADLFVLAFLILMAVSFYRYPVSLTFLKLVFGYQSELVGAAPYIAFIAFFISYICFSCIPFEKKVLLKLLKWHLIILLVCQSISVVIALAWKDAWQDEDGVRYPMFTAWGRTIFIAVYCSAPFLKLMASPKAIFLLMLSILASFVSGSRGHLLGTGIIAFTTIIIKREYYVILIGLVIMGGTLSILSASNVLSQMPYTIQRPLSMIPGINIDNNIKRGADSTATWRFEMWKWALDPRTELIKNYMFGDGFGISSSYLGRSGRAVRRGSLEFGNKRDFALTRNWHSCFIYTLQSLGWVGVFVSFFCYVYATFMMYKINTALKETPYFMYSMLYTGYTVYYFSYFFSVSTMQIFFNRHLLMLAYLKVFYHIAVDEGKIIPNRSRAKYKPLLIKQHSVPA